MIAETVKNKRLSMGISSKALSERSGVSRQTVLNIERGMVPKYDTLCRVAEVLGLKVEFTVKDAA